MKKDIYAYQETTSGVVRSEELNDSMLRASIIKTDDNIIEDLEAVQDERFDCRYSYQDWLDGKFEPCELSNLLNRYELSFEVYSMIVYKQHQAIVKLLGDVLEEKKRLFKETYHHSMISQDYLEVTIQQIQFYKNDIIENKEEIYTNAVYGNDGRKGFTAKQIDECLNHQISEINPVEVYSESILEIVNENKAFIYTINSNFLKWLLWFKQIKIKSYSESTMISNNDNHCIEEKENGVEESESITEGKVSYDWLSNPDEELPKLHKLLISKKYGLIHPSTTLEQFRSVFKSKPLDDIQPIKWIKAKNLLAYFIDQLQENGKISEPKIWSIANKCFTKSRDLGQSKHNYTKWNRGGTPKGSEVINDVLNNLQ